MTRDELAALLNGREYRDEITDQEEAQAKAAGLLVIFGASDDLVEFRGAFRDEAGAYGSTTVRVHPQAALPAWEDLDKDDEATVRRYFEHEKSAHPIDVKFAPGDDYTWIIETALPHSTFEIVEDGGPFCRGIVIDTKDMVAAQ